MRFDGKGASDLEHSILILLSYYEIFRHPLKLEEIVLRIGLKNASKQSVNHTLEQLVSENVISKQDVYYSLNYHDNAVLKRNEGETRAKKMMKIARFMSKLIYAFPFVRSVFISGSLSKGSIPEDADIDFFIITRKNRLWIARTMLVIFKRVVLFNSKKYFCTNYFVDENTLEIPDKNMFTATEVSTLIPICGIEYYTRFMQANNWCNDFFPNLKVSHIKKDSQGIIKKTSQKLIEPLFLNGFADQLDKVFMKKTHQRWIKMYGGNYSEKEFELAFRSRRGTSKNHDRNFQKKVLNAVENNFYQSINRLQKKLVNG